MPRTQVVNRTQVATRTGNVVRNGNFETRPSSFTAATNTGNRWVDGTTAGSSASTAYGWLISASTVSAQFDTSTFNSGTASMKVSTTSTNQNAIVQPFKTGTSDPVLQLMFKIQSSTKYLCSFYMKTNYTSGDSNDGAFLSIRRYNSAGTQVGSSTSTKIKATTNWTKYTVSFTSESTGVLLGTLLTVTGNTGTATLILDSWFDDIQICALQRTLVASRTRVT